MFHKDRENKLALSCFNEKGGFWLDIRLKIYIFYTCILNTVMSNKGASSFLLIYLCWRASLYVIEPNVHYKLRVTSEQMSIDVDRTVTYPFEIVWLIICRGFLLMFI